MDRNNTVTISLQTYNDLRDFRDEVYRKKNIPVRSINDRTLYYLTEIEIVKDLTEQIEILQKQIKELKQLEFPELKRKELLISEQRERLSILLIQGNEDKKYIKSLLDEKNKIPKDEISRPSKGLYFVSFFIGLVTGLAISLFNK